MSLYALERNIDMAEKLRNVAALHIQEDPETYNEAILGKEREKYIKWIQTSSAWGGAIEIDSIDVQSGRIDKFGEGASDGRILVMYSGIHYDALALAPAEGCSPEFDQTRFSSHDQHILHAAQKLAEVLRKQHKYTDVANFTLKCQQCQTGLIGEKDAQSHAMTTGHTRFVEY
ncbi:ubiquitin-specific protease otu1 [Apophysomyces sp. BC1015]|nr:ubiquitin-specific protease otu1 [Apophysomyces sp. BC1015]